MPTNLPANRRGLVMLLVLISLAMAVILATAYLASRDNSVPLSRNAAASAGARWAVLSAQESAVAVLETRANWRAMSQGVLLNDYDLAGAMTRVEARDLETGSAPTATTRHVRITASAEVDRDEDGSPDGREQAIFLAYVPTVPDPYAVVDLSDFAIFTRKTITLRNQAMIARWPMAPLSTLGRRMNLGTNASGSGDVSVLDQAACIDCTVHHPVTSSPTLVNDASGPPIAERDINFTIPFPEAPPPGVVPLGTHTDYKVDGVDIVFSTDQRFDRISVRTGGRLTLSGDITLIAEEDLRLESPDVRLIINGHVKVVVFRDLIITPNAAIELVPGSTLDLYVSDDLEITDGYIGEQRPDSLRDHTGHAPYIDINTIRIFSIDPNPTAHEWFLHDNSVVKGNIYGTEIRLAVLGDSAIYGRVAVESLTLENASAIFYDHAIDQRRGFTRPQSPLYSGSNLNPALVPVSLDPALLQALAIATFTTLRANTVDYAPLPVPPPPPPPPGTPTPRPLQVEYTLETFGPDMESWENSGTSG